MEKQWRDASLLLDRQLPANVRMIRDSAATFAQSEMQPRVITSLRNQLYVLHDKISCIKQQYGLKLNPTFGK